MTALIPIKTAAALAEVSEKKLKRLYYSKCNNYRIKRIDGAYYAVENWERGGTLATEIEGLYFQAVEIAGGDWALARLLGGRAKTLAYYRYIRRFCFTHFLKALSFRAELICF
ncbi:MAG: hypothetical protein LBN32_01485 [Helicobacteraceae bacterium]|jgi:hypothetical protein|nr:hypothetical protein [Helicobacteraceae bacterium]